MAPKKGNEPSKKTEQKEKAKIIEDKTFGLKNKNKSAKVNKFVEQVKAQVQASGKDRKAQKEEELRLLQRKQKKEEEETAKKEAALLGKPVIIQPKVPFGADPKSFLCQLFKHGECNKGEKCKYSHDINVERKSAKIDLYSDARDEEKKAKELDTMDKWDQSKLETVVLKKQGPGIRTTTDIVCKYFLEAIESRKYGWFWECPNGGNLCKYRHALPPGFVLKAKAPINVEDDEEAISLEEFLEGERRNLAGVLTPITSDSFKKWKEDRQRRQEIENLANAKKKQEDIKAGKAQATGKELFTVNPDLFHMDDEEAMESDQLKDREEDFFVDHEGITTAPELIDEELFLAEELSDLGIE